MKKIVIFLAASSLILPSLSAQEMTEKKIEQNDFSTVLLKDDFEKRIPGNWQSGKGKFFHDDDSGIDDTASAALDLDGSTGKSMRYLISFPPKDFEFFKATISYKAEDFPAPTRNNSWRRIVFSIQWQGPVGNPPKNDWLDKSTATVKYEKINTDGKWHKLTVYGRRPKVPFTRVFVLFGTDGAAKGSVYFDNVEVRGAKGN